MYRELGEVSYQKEAVQELEEALGAWKAYAAASMEQYHNPFWTNRVGHVDWARITRWVEEDISIAESE
jgi:hypothetical protein